LPENLPLDSPRTVNTSPGLIVSQKTVSELSRINTTAWLLPVYFKERREMPPAQGLQSVEDGQLQDCAFICFAKQKNINTSTNSALVNDFSRSHKKPQ
jgi:hypothetical protein